MSPPNRIGIDPTLMTQLIVEIKRLQPAWSQVDAQIDSALRTVGTSMTGPGLLRDIGSQIAARAPDLQRRLDLIIATQKIGLDKGVVWADESLWVSSSPAGGRAIAKSVADQLREAARLSGVNDKVVTSELLDLLEKHQHDPYFAVAFANEMGPKELRAVLAKLHRPSAESRANRGPNDPLTTEAERLFRTLSVTLGTASRGVGDMKLPKGYAEELLTSQDEPMAGSIVNRLLRYGSFDDAFLLDLVSKVYDSTRMPSDEAQPIRFGPGIAAALANNPRVAQDFFTDPVRKPLSYLMRENNWAGESQEMGRAIEAATTVYRDHGQPPGSSRGYKSALIASWAIHFWADPRAQWAMPDSRQSAARVFSAYIGDINRISPEAKDFIGVNPLPDPDPLLPGKQPYGASFDDEATQKVMTWAFDDTEALKTVMASHGKYSVMVLDAQAAQIKKENEALLNDWHRTHPDASKVEIDAQRQMILKERMTGFGGKLFTARVADLSTSLKFIVDAGNQADINAADARDRTRDVWKKVAIDTLKLTVTPAGDWVVAGVEQLGDVLTEEIKSEDGKIARRNAETTLSTSQNMFRDLIADAMMRHGLFGEATTDTHPHGSENYAKDTPQDFVRDGHLLPRSMMTDDQDRAYLEWLKLSPASGLFRDAQDAVADGFRNRP